MSTAEVVASQSERLASLDQFRGYTVAGMFLVNYAGSFAAVAAFLPTLHHWHNHCSFADTIMPQFLFAVGFGFRLSYLKRRENGGARASNWRVVRRILGLLLVALFVHNLDGKYDSWQKLQELGLGGFLQTAFQRNYFQTLAHIGVTSLWVVPVIGLGMLPRLLYAVASCCLFVGLSSIWYYDWELTRPGIDGGPLGFLTWSAPLILGTIAFDVWKSNIRRKVFTMISVGLLAMLIGYGLSCASRFTFPNSLPEDALWSDRLAENPFVRPFARDESELQNELEAQSDTSHGFHFLEALTVAGQENIPKARGQVLEHWIHRRNRVYDQLKNSGQLESDLPRQQLTIQQWQEPGKRYLNQWTMSQRAGSPSYTIFGGGLAMVLMGLMIVVCDRWGYQIGLFRTLGVNALIGYILHGMVNQAIKPFVPKDSPLWFVFLGFLVSLSICYLVLRTLEKQKIIFKL